MGTVSAGSIQQIEYEDECRAQIANRVSKIISPRAYVTMGRRLILTRYVWVKRRTSVATQTTILQEKSEGGKGMGVEEI